MSEDKDEKSPNFRDFSFGNNDQYEDYLKSKTLEDLLEIESFLNKLHNPERYKLVINRIKEIEEEAGFENKNIENKLLGYGSEEEILNRKCCTVRNEKPIRPHVNIWSSKWFYLFLSLVAIVLSLILMHQFISSSEVLFPAFAVVVCLLIISGFKRFIGDIILYRDKRTLLSKYPDGFICNGTFYSRMVS